MAIALLPLKEGETLNSNFGRYIELIGLKSTWTLRRSLFGCESDPRSRLPIAIDHLAEQTRDYWNLTGAEIVKEHTEYQYATMMASESIRRTILQVMLASHAHGKFPFGLRIFGLKGERTATLRYCEACLAEWIEKRQTPYWRIDHQLAGVYCCFKHACILKSVNRPQSNSYFDQTVLRLINTSDETVLKRLTASEKRAVEDIAKRSSLQRAEGRICKPNKIYRDMIKEVGFVRARSRINHEAMISTWLDYFGVEYCHVTGMTAAKVSKWVNRLSEQNVRAECAHPFMFIAAESFLEHHIELPGSYSPQISTKGPNVAEVAEPAPETYSCKGALHRSADVLKSAPNTNGRWKLVCTCGISYRIREAARCDVAQLIPFSYAARYRNRCVALIVRGASINDAAKQLSVASATARHWANKERVSDFKTLPQGKVRKLRATWRRLVQNASPQRRISAAAEADPAVYKALFENDKVWLRTFNLSHRSPGRTKGSVRLKEPTSDQIREAWRELISATPPIMATRSAMLEKAGFRRALGRNRTFEAVLVELVESCQAYHERVISWLANLASGQRLGDCDEAIRAAGLRRSRFTLEQRERIRAIESMNSVEIHSLREY
ncbi:hypothetical protein AWB78_07242 [Caballeronia calidae]|uniref:Uncharacterized protein n=1 Tax=Caballeronia calidae TaxID=1777139 RepID=A0A158EGH4_9BURK|nr:TnsD family Tn7-like transposition protein [Caballeronia calidae]SAL05007.1 hypothetical protein AWB78_07242 [Caballeronia calidae]